MFVGNGGTYRVTAVFGGVFIERKGADEACFASQLIGGFYCWLGNKTLLKQFDDDFRFAASRFDTITGECLFESLRYTDGGGHDRLDKKGCINGNTNPGVWQVRTTG